ncbi:30S ribosomal protein S24e [Methanocaldococcus indicus]|uniref:30S ribosomal protein S24e n=1 Tax=Methanocaldococcus indicus TaxID=213231 RepID=UPI003C6D2C7D
MIINIISKRYNPLLKRTEVRFYIDHDGATPKFMEVRDKLAAMLNADKNLLVVEKIVEETGMQRARGYAKLYDSEDMLRFIEREHILRKNGLIEEKEGEE